MIPGRRTAEGQLIITAGPPLSTDPRMAGFALKPTGEIYVAGTQSAFTPEDLFLNGEQGAFYDPSDLATMFQDSAGTTPVTADGQPVGLILDKSGNGNHASQTTATARPLYKTDGTYHWLQFDGVDDKFQVTLPTTVNTCGIFAGLLYSGIDPVSLTTGTANGSTVSIYNSKLSISSANGIVSSSSCASSPKFVGFIEGRQNDTGVAHRNAVDLGISPIVGGVGISDLKNISIAVNSNGAGNFTVVSLYSLVVRGALSTTDEITETEEWVNGKTGAY